MKLLIKIYYFLLRVYYFFLDLSCLFYEKRLYDSPTYYPEYADRKKSKVRIIFDQVINLLTRGSVNYYYFLYGFDINKFREPNSYIDERNFYMQRNYLRESNPNNHTAILRDKLAFFTYASAINIPTPLIIGFIEQGLVKPLHCDSNYNAYEFILEHNFDVFIKAINGECGNDVHHVCVTDKKKVVVDSSVVTKDYFTQLFSKGKYIIQERICNQNPIINSIHPHAINTIRLTTIKKGNTFAILPPLLRVGVGKKEVDNWAEGGLAIGIDEKTGSLKRYGFYKPGYGIKTETHPDTGVVFSEIQIPYLKESIDLAIRFHKNLSTIHSIGWDIAITSEGPVIIEGNDNWEITLVQACSHVFVVVFIFC